MIIVGYPYSYNGILYYRIIIMWIATREFHFIESNKDLFAGKDVLSVWRQTNYLSQKECNTIWIQKEEYCENIFHLLWAKQINSIDYSDYESPTHIHDFNVPLINNEFVWKYDIVFDGGSTEHMFNAVQAFYNYNKIIKVWGYYMGVLPMNNHVNHGFYQFSPDFFYNLFSEERWYKTSCFVYNQGWYKIRDLREFKEVYHSNLSISSYPNLIYVIAHKTEDKKIFSDYPKQTVYNKFLWQTDNSNISSQENKHKVSIIKKIYRSIIPGFLKGKIQKYMTKKKMLEKVDCPLF